MFSKITIINKTYLREKKLGSGRKGSVYQVSVIEEKSEKEDDSWVDIKSVEAQTICIKHESSEVRAILESKILRLMHPEFLSEVFTDGHGNYYITMPFHKGVSLERFLKEKVSSFEQAREIALQLTEQVSRLHAAGYLHRDIKADNVMINIDLEGKINVSLIDFGRSAFYRKVGDAYLANNTIFVDSLWATYQRTRPQIAPEYFDSPHKIGPSSDHYSLGRLLQRMFSQDSVRAGIDRDVISAIDIELAGLTNQDPDQRPNLVNVMRQLTELSSKAGVGAGAGAAACRA